MGTRLRLLEPFRANPLTLHVTGEGADSLLGSRAALAQDAALLAFLLELGLQNHPSLQRAVAFSNRIDERGLCGGSRFLCRLKLPGGCVPIIRTASLVHTRHGRVELALCPVSAAGRNAELDLGLVGPHRGGAQLSFEFLGTCLRLLQPLGAYPFAFHRGDEVPNPLLGGHGALLHSRNLLAFLLELAGQRGPRLERGVPLADGIGEGSLRGDSGLLGRA